MKYWLVVTGVRRIILATALFSGGVAADGDSIFIFDSAPATTTQTQSEVAPAAPAKKPADVAEPEKATGTVTESGAGDKKAGQDG